jgi:hypothetical protein
MENLLMSEVQSSPDVNVRSGVYYIARTRAPCGHCGLMTGVLALAVPPEHETLDLEADGDLEAEGDPEADGDRKTSSVGWQLARANAFLFYVEYLPDPVRDRLQNLSASFRFAYSDATQNSCWVNHCDHCGRLLDDHELHCEPEGAFMPVSEAAAAGIELLRVEEPFEAAADGYAFEPEFFSLMRRV